MSNFIRPVIDDNGNTKVIDSNIGATSDTAKTDSSQSGSLISFIKGLVSMIKDVWDSTNHVLKASILPLSNTIDKITSYPATDAIMNGTTALTPKTAIANVAQSQTDSNVVTAVAGKKIRVVALVAQAGATATNLTFNSKGAGSGVAISPTFQNGVNGGEVLLLNPTGWFETNSGEGLTVTTGAGSTTGILVEYVEV